MSSTLQQFVVPLVTAVFTLWAAWLTFAAESDADLPRLIAGELPHQDGPVPLARALHVAHLTLLVLAGTGAGLSVLWWRWSAAGALVRLLVAVGVVGVVADLLPRILAAVAPELTEPARRTAARTLSPFLPILRLVARFDRPMSPAAAGAAGIATGAQPRRSLGHAQREMLHGIFALADTTVAEVMTPRIDIVAVDVGDEHADVVRVLRRSEHARILVYDGGPDQVAGVIYAKDMLATLGRGDAPAWQTLIRPATFVPVGKTLDRQLRDFQRGPSHIAVVIDEFGGTAGIVTLEDILEQIVGEIQDEYDVEEVAPIQELADGGYRVQGGVALAELEAVLGHEFGREDVSTVGGLVLAEFGRVPRWGETVRVDGYEIVVEQVARRRIRRIALRPVPAEAEADETVSEEAER